MKVFIWLLALLAVLNSSISAAESTEDKVQEFYRRIFAGEPTGDEVQKFYRSTKALTFNYKKNKWVTKRVKDNLWIQEQDDHAISFIFVLTVFDGQQVCSMKGLAYGKEGAYEYRESDDEPDSKCVLKLTIRKDKITLQDKGNQCREVNCGASVRFDGVKFVREKTK